MGVQVAEFTDEEEGEGGVGDVGICRAGSGGSRTVGPEGQVDAGQGPVISRVLDQVDGRHGGRREAVHEQGLEFPLGEVCHHQPKGERLERRRLGVRETQEYIEERVDQERPEVFE